jgi:rhodanese-related sulfurtransferase
MKYNSTLRIRDKAKFIESLTTAMPPAPDHFTRLSAINRKGPALVETLPALELLDPITFKKKTEGKNTIVLDLRSVDAFGGQHVPGAYHIDFGGNFATFAGWILPPDRDILLVAHSFTQAQEASVWLNRVGLDRAIGYLKEGMFGWAKAGLPMGHVPQLSSEELRQLVVGKEKISLIDVRAPREYEENHIKGAVNIPLPDLRTGYKDFKRKIPIVLICSTGHRSSLGTSILKQQGISTVLNAAGGMTGYSAAGYASECPVCVAPHVPAFPGKGT